MSFHHDDDDEEVDYMSPTFLVTQEDQTQSLSTVRRKNQHHSANQESKHKLHIQRQLQLKRKLDDSNKGMQLLKKLGFKEGQGLGKFENGMKEPIPIHNRLPARAGLGSTDHIHFQESDSGESALSDPEDDAIRKDTFRYTKSTQLTDHLLVQDVKRARRLLYHFDSEKEVPEFTPFWPLDLQPTPTPPIIELECSDDDQSSLEMSLCRNDGIDRSKLDFNINTVTEDEFQFKQLDQLSDNAREFELLKPVDQLDQLLDILRSSYLYCMYCAIQFGSENELGETCPGPSRTDH